MRHSVDDEQRGNHGRIEVSGSEATAGKDAIHDHHIDNEDGVNLKKTIEQVSNELS